MDADEFRDRAHQLVDWMADYLRDVESHNVVPNCAPGEIRAKLPTEPPDSPEAFDAIFRDFRSLIVPGMTHWNHPGWFGYFPANNSPPSILAEMLVATLGAQCMSWQTSPAATELEEVTLDWLRQLLGLPETLTGVIQDSASSASLVALLCAREQALQSDRQSLNSLTVYASAEAHASVEKAAKLAGFRSENFRTIPVDGRFALDPKALAEAISEDRRAGRQPACIVATLGTTSSTAIDPLAQIAAIARDVDCYLHVDAAYAGAAALLPECRSMLAGIDSVDSFVFNPHKWLLVNFDCSAHFVRDVDLLLKTMSTAPDYLKTAHDADVKNFRDWGIPLGRRFRALKLWFVLRSYGSRGLRDMLRQHIAWGHRLHGWVDAAANFETMAPSPLGLVCLRWHPRDWAGDNAELDALNLELLRRVNACGDVYLTHTRLAGQVAIRVAIGQRTTNESDVHRVWDTLREQAATL
ncbi:MAG: aminotransferase class V-fold PLP-dependent enzyme [Myxococcota bacterium]